MQLNAEDGGNRKFIMVQLPEPCKEDSEAFKAGYKNICEIGKERIRRAGKKIVKEQVEANKEVDKLDVGFRVFKVDSSNMKDVYYSAEQYDQNILDSLVSNIKENRTDLDLLYGVLLNWGLTLDKDHRKVQVDNVTVHFYDTNGQNMQNAKIAAYFTDKITENIIRGIANFKPSKMVFKDSSFTSSAEKINLEGIFKVLFPDTEIKVL